MARNKETVAPEGTIESERLRQLYPAFDRFEGRDFGGLAASLALHFLVLMGMWSATRAPQPPKPYLVEVEILQAEPIKTASRATPTKSAKLSTRVSKAKQKPPKPSRQKPQPHEATPEPREYEMAAQVVKAKTRGGKLRRQAAKVALPDVSQPVAMSSRADLNQARLTQPTDQTAAASLQNSEQRGTLKPRLASVGQQASSRMQSPVRAGVEAENGPKLIASNAPAAQTLTPEYRHSARPGGKYSSQGGAAQPAMGGGPASESAQAYSLQSSSLMGSPAGNPAARGYVANAAPAQGAGRAAGQYSGPATGQVSGPAARGAARSSAAAPTEIRSVGGQGELAASGAPINPLQIKSAGGTGAKAGAGTAAGPGTSAAFAGGGDASQPGGGSSRGMEEGGGSGALLASSGGGRSVGPAARSMSAAIVPEGGASMSAGMADATAAAPMQRVAAQGTAHVMEERYAAKELKVSSPKSVCELPLMMAGLDRKPLPEGLASIMGSESAMVMETPPVLLPGNIQPGYPASAVFSRVQGKAVVRAQVLANGQVGEAFIKQSSGAQVLDRAALASVRAWRFKPARRNGEPVPAWVNVPIEYRNPS